MKRILTAILAFLYLSTSMGATIHLHYCMGKLISWDLSNHESKTCALCGMEKEKGMKDDHSSNKNCCRDEHKTIKADRDQKVDQNEFRFTTISSDPLIVYYQESAPGIPSIAIQSPKANSPPPLSRQPIFLLNRNFRI
jgi:hypothetical protein